MFDWAALSLGRLLKKTHRLRCARPIARQRTKSTPPLIGLRAPRLWAFLSSLQEVCFSRLLFAEIRRGHAEFVLEGPTEMRQVFEAAVQGDLRNVERGIFEQHGRVFQALLQ